MAFWAHVRDMFGNMFLTLPQHLRNTLFFDAPVFHVLADYNCGESGMPGMHPVRAARCCTAYAPEHRPRRVRLCRALVVEPREIWVTDSFQTAHSRDTRPLPGFVVTADASALPSAIAATSAIQRHRILRKLPCPSDVLWLRLAFAAREYNVQCRCGMYLALICKLQPCGRACAALNHRSGSLQANRVVHQRTVDSESHHAQGARQLRLRLTEPKRRAPRQGQRCRAHLQSKSCEKTGTFGSSSSSSVSECSWETHHANGKHVVFTRRCPCGCFA